MLVARYVRFIGKDFLVFALVEYAAFRVCSGNRLFCCFRRGASFRAPLAPCLSHQTIREHTLCFFGYSFACLFLQICTCLYVRAVYKYGFGVQTSLVRSRL